MTKDETTAPIGAGVLSFVKIDENFAIHFNKTTKFTTAFSNRKETS